MPQKFTKIYIDHKFVPGREIRKYIDMIEGFPPKWERPEAPVQIINTTLNNSKHRAEALGAPQVAKNPKKNQLDELRGVNYIII